MVKPKMTALVASAIRNLREIRGSTSKEIMNYIKMQYNAADANTRKQVSGLGLSNAVQIDITLCQNVRRLQHCSFIISFLRVSMCLIHC